MGIESNLQLDNLQTVIAATIERKCFGLTCVRGTTSILFERGVVANLLWRTWTHPRSLFASTLGAYLIAGVLTS